ncbi:MAG: universal stress protein [Cytophagaceae bacterium]
MIKKDPFPFEKIAVAVALSPSIEEIICKAVFFAKKFNAELLFIHIKRNEKEDIQKMNQLIERHASGISYTMEMESGDVVESILAITKKHSIDLLIAGALEKESYLRYYLGSVSRKLSRKAKCSVLLLKEPSLNPKPFIRLVVNGAENPKTIHTLETAIYFSQGEEASEIYLVKENELSGLATLINEDFEDNKCNYRNQIISEEYAKLYNLLKKVRTSGSEVKPILLDGKPGYELSCFARSIKADLLVVNSADSRKGFLDRIFPDDLEYVLENLPCSLLIVHSRVS